MSNEIGDEMRAAFLDMLEMIGTDCQAAGESRKALVQEDKKTGATLFKFADEFPIKAGDKIKNRATEADFSVLQARPVSKAGSYHHFEVTAK